MKTAVLLAFAAGLPIWAGAVDEAASVSTNVNSRYIIEGVNVSGSGTQSISGSLKAELKQVVGANLDTEKLDRLAARIKEELKAARVKVHVTRGTVPGHVMVNFEVAKKPVDLKVAKFLYDTQQGWSGEGSMTTRLGGNAFTLGLVSDGDELLERYAGIRARFDRDDVIAGRLGVGFEFDDFHEMWNGATESEDPSGIYRSRQVFRPEARVTILAPLELDFGFEFARYRLSTPGPAETESSNAVVSTLRYHRRWGSGSEDQEQELDSSYSVGAATGVFSSDANYTKHLAQAHYRFRRNRHWMDVVFMAGRILGQAPLFDRFVLGNAELLRGWNRFGLDPAGGSRLVYGSSTYTYRYFQVFYDTGAVWDVSPERQQRQSMGAGFKKEGFQLAVAFPVRSGPVAPIFFAGMNF